jgi:hypothetical protein
LSRDSQAQSGASIVSARTPTASGIGAPVHIRSSLPAAAKPLVPSVGRPHDFGLVLGPSPGLYVLHDHRSAIGTRAGITLDVHPRPLLVSPVAKPRKTGPRPRPSLAASARRFASIAAPSRVRWYRSTRQRPRSACTLVPFQITALAASSDCPKDK